MQMYGEKPAQINRAREHQKVRAKFECEGTPKNLHDKSSLWSISLDLWMTLKPQINIRIPDTSCLLSAGSNDNQKYHLVWWW